MKFFLAITFCLLQVSFGSEYGDAIPFDSGNSEITSSILRERLNGPYIEAKPLLSNDSVIYINAVLQDINSTVEYDHGMHLRNIFENFTEENKLLILSNFFFKLYEYLELSLFEQFRKENYPNSRLSDFKKCSENGSRNCKWAHAALLVINFALVKQRVSPGPIVMIVISELIRNLENGPSIDRGVEFTRLIISLVITERGGLRKSDKEAFKSLLLFQKDFIKLSLDCIKKAFKPSLWELIGSQHISLPYKIDGIIDCYQLGEPKPPIHS